ncbi:MAG: minor capsid protein [Faecalibacterium sp.]
MSKPVFPQPYGLRYRVDDVQMELSWRPDFGAEKTAALQKAQFALSQEAVRLIDQYVPMATGTLKRSVNLASKYDEGLLVYNTPYARKQYYLHPEGTDLRGENKLRGSYWGQRALADYGEALAFTAAKAVTTFWGGGQ